MERKIFFCGRFIPAELLSAMIAANKCYEGVDCICRDCGRLTLYRTEKELANHLTKYHPNDPKWDVANVDADAIEKALNKFYDP